MTPEQTRFVQMLYQQHHDAMRYLAQKIVKDPEAAADAVSQTFLIAILKIDTVMRCDEPARWLFHVLKNAAIDEYRRARRGAVPLDGVEDTAVEDDLLPFPDLLPTGLTAEEREILTLRIHRQMEYDDIARMLHVSSAACRMKFSRARKRCAELMRQEQNSLPHR